MILEAVETGMSLAQMGAAIGAAIAVIGAAFGIGMIGKSATESIACGTLRHRGVSPRSAPVKQ